MGATIGINYICATCSGPYGELLHSMLFQRPQWPGVPWLDSDMSEHCSLFLGEHWHEHDGAGHLLPIQELHPCLDEKLFLLQRGDADPGGAWLAQWAGIWAHQLSDPGWVNSSFIAEGLYMFETLLMVTYRHFWTLD